MKKRIFIGLSAAALATVFSGCSSVSMDVPFSETDKVSECIKTQKDLGKVNALIAKVSALPASQVEEYLAAMPARGITNSSEKRPVLRDAHSKKAQLEAKQRQLGCEVQAKK